MFDFWGVYIYIRQGKVVVSYWEELIWIFEGSVELLKCSFYNCKSWYIDFYTNAILNHVCS